MFTVSALTALSMTQAIYYDIPDIYSESNRVFFLMQFIFFASCAPAFETWKQCQWIMRTLNFKHKIWGKNWLYLRTLFKSLPCFQCSWNLQGTLIDDWSGDLQVYKKNLSSGFLNNEKFVGMDQITCKNRKSSWMQVNKIRTSDRPEQFPSFSVRSFQ